MSGIAFRLERTGECVVFGILFTATHRCWRRSGGNDSVGGLTGDEERCGHFHPIRRRTASLSSTSRASLRLIRRGNRSWPRMSAATLFPMASGFLKVGAAGATKRGYFIVRRAIAFPVPQRFLWDSALVAATKRSSDVDTPG